MAIISLQDISMSFGGPPVLEGLNLQIEKNQRVCLLGRNGSGKSTLMKIIHGSLSPDRGVVQKDQSIKISYCAQTIPHDLEGTVLEIVAQGLGTRGKLFLHYHRGAPNYNEPDTVHDELHAYDGWSAAENIEKIISRMSLNPKWEYKSLSGGQKRLVLLAAALVSEPDLLLLDEPTNHLDINAIAWMEEFLLRIGITILFVTHDRMLLRKLATRIIELDRGTLIDWSCNYDTFLKRKQAVLDIEEKEWENFDRKLDKEEMWIRRGIKARRTRNEGRVRSLMMMREERKKRRQREGTASMKIVDAERSGKLVIEAKCVSFGFDEKVLINDFSTVILRGDKVGIIGPNGCGKTTLMNLLLGNHPPLSGTIRHGTKLSIVYFDQLRKQLDEEKTVLQNVLPNGDFVFIDNKKKHIISYLQDFLFTPDRAKMCVRYLSGGERNRLLLAQLFTKPSNLLVLDEPTNDLDAETLELLEELLITFKGTVLLICHDRTFLDNVVTSTLVFSDNGVIYEYAGGYYDWLEQEKNQQLPVKKIEKIDKKKIYKQEKKLKQKRKLTFKETKLLHALPGLIEAREKERDELYVKMADPDFYRSKEKVVEAKNRLAELERELIEAYEEWEHLESIS